MALDRWHKSSYSNGDANCVEVCEGRDLVGLRDTKEAGLGDDRTTLRVPRASFADFLADAKAGRFTL